MSSTFKTARAVLIILAFVIESVGYELAFSILRETEKTRFCMRAEKIGRYSRAMLRALGIRLRTPLALPDLAPGLIVCNHLSYVDVFVLAATVPSLFVTSVEVRNQGFLGAICRVAGCLFVERRSRAGLRGEIRAIDLVLALGTPVVVFPEATSSEGADVLPFKAALYQAAIDARVPIHQFCLRYREPEVAYHGDMTFGSHFMRLLSLCAIEASLRYVGTLDETTRPCDRFEIARESHRLIQHAFHSH